MTGNQNVVHKLKVLRAELEAYRTHADQALDLDHAVLGGPSLRGSSWVGVQQFLRPEVLLRLANRQDSPIYATLSSLDPPVVIQANLESVEEQIKALEGPPSKDAISAAIRVLESAVSRRMTGADLSRSQSALAKIRTTLLGN